MLQLIMRCDNLAKISHTKFSRLFLICSTSGRERNTKLINSDPTGDRTLIDVMTALMDKYSQGGKAEKAPPSATCLQPGLPCCARYEYDNMWYRATVVSAVDADNVKVGSHLTPSPPRVINVNFPLQPHQKYNTILYGELGFSGSDAGRIWVRVWVVFLCTFGLYSCSSSVCIRVLVQVRIVLGFGFGS